jgi:hypothetical protein
VSKVFIIVAIVVAAAGLLFTGYDILMFNLGLPSIVAFLGSLWPDITSGFGIASESTAAWIIGLTTAVIATLLVARWPKYRKY